MMPKPPGRLRSLYADLDAMSSLVRDAFRGAAPQMTPLLTPSSLQAWAEEGLGLARGGSRSWDAAAEYFRASPAMAQQLTARRFLGWARRGRTLAAESGVVAAAFYKASPAAIAHLPHSGINAWADMGQRLCTVADFADTLARRFFDASPRLLQYSPPETLEQLVRLLAVVTPHSLDMGTDVLNQAVRLFPDVRSRDLTAFLDDGERLAKQNHHAVRAYFDAGLAIYVRLGSADRDLYLELINAVAMAAPRSLPTYLSETARHLGPVVAARGAVPLVLSARIAGLSTAAAREFIRNAPMLTTKLTNDELTLWCSRGEALLANHEAAGIGYFRLQSREALEAVSSLSPAVELEEVREVLRLYCQALMGRTISIVAAEKVSERAATHWTSSEELDWEGAAIFCPSRMQEFPSKEGNFEAYKVLATHQAGHLEFGTFEFVFKSDGALLTPIRQTLADIMGKVRTYYTEFDQFFDLFSDRRLARDLFTIAEDTRIDHQVRDEYRGIRRPYRRVQENSAQGRPDYRHMPMREQFVEMLVRMSLEAEPIYEAPKELSQQLWVAAGLINLMNNHATAAEDAAEAAVRLYVLLRLVPNFEAEQFDNADWIEMDLSEARYDPLAEDRDQIIRAFLEVNQQQPNFKGSGEVPEQGEDDNEEDYKSPQGVGHRGDLKPELGQAIQKLQQQARQAAQRQPKPGEPGEDGETALSDQDYDMQMLQDLIDNAGELFEDWEAGSEAFEGMLPSLLIGGLLRNYTGNKDQPKALMQPEAPHLGEDEVQTTIYDEWDYRAKAYRPKWCQVRQRVLKEGSGEFYSNAVAEHRALVNAVRRQFEMLRPENLGKVKRLLDGEEFDLDAVIDARIERRSGHTPSEKIYWRRNKIERNVAVVLLVDLSLSTDERIERESVRLAREAPTDRSRRMAQKRIIDLEREGVVLFIEALEQIGDTYGIYGFSGSGREDVQFYTIKDTQEPLTERVRRRVDKVTPLQGTRMGPAIRHAISKLEKTEAKTKILIMLSDGRPQDRDYGTLPWDPEALPRNFLRSGDYGMIAVSRDALMLDEKEYAVHDTKQALNEAKTKNITPFCISVDKQGHDYLKAMCGDIGYEVVSDIESLPRRLPALYRRLTT